MAAVDLGIRPPGEPEVSTPPAGDDAPLAGADVDQGAVHTPLEVAPPVGEATVRGLLASAGGVLHVAMGDPDVEEHWQFTPSELAQLTPPLTRWINRHERLKRAVAHGDELTVAVALAGYVGRNVADGQEAAKARKKEPDGDEPREDPRAPRGADAQGGAADLGWPGRDGRVDGGGGAPPPGGAVAR